jgi:hypothetical protein
MDIGYKGIGYKEVYDTFAGNIDKAKGFQKHLIPSLLEREG